MDLDRPVRRAYGWLVSWGGLFCPDAGEAGRMKCGFDRGVRVAVFRACAAGGFGKSPGDEREKGGCGLNRNRGGCFDVEICCISAPLDGGRGVEAGLLRDGGLRKSSRSLGEFTGDRGCERRN